MLAVVTPSLQLGGIAGNFASGSSRSVMATGLVPEERNRMLGWNDYKIISYAPPLPLAGAADDAVVVGTGVARKLGLCSLIEQRDCGSAKPAQRETSGPALPDDIAALSSQEANRAEPAIANRIEMLAATAHGAPNVAGLQAVKATNMGIKALDDVYMAMQLKQAQRLVYGQSAPQVTAIIVQLKHTAQIPQARARLAALLAEVKGQDLEVVDFYTLNPMYVQTREFMDSMFGFIAMLIGVIVLFTIGNTMSTAVMERTAEIGTLRAMGQRRSGIRRLFLAEAAILGAAGALIGVTAALLVANGINHSGWTWTPPGYSYAYLVLVRVGEDLPMLVGCVIGMMAVTVMSAWWPARRAANSVIVDALRHA
jgi:putative ABC transport system permease protein